MNNQTHIVIDNVITGKAALAIAGLSILGAATIIGVSIYGATKLVTKTREKNLIFKNPKEFVKELTREI